MLSIENRSKCSDLCVSIPRARTTTAKRSRQTLVWRMLIGLQLFYLNFITVYFGSEALKTLEPIHAVPFLRSNISLAVVTDSKVKRRCLLVLVF
ncbi:hypothetical protein TSAR_002836 [Trichomalopsis sarcophagae]|uniref:Uncharacterized protein n=1 Tax=Trichomalopsis sarcophagae TaxID=543379 RepID=A0A232F5A4_9HYME|nr:hypothetical protein TSAR_002836 [Trichomalopsis sarcophagae]